MGPWRPKRKAGIGERVCRLFFEYLFNDSFPKSLAEWLANENENQLDIDGYFERLKLGFEHHRKQLISSSATFRQESPSL